MARGAWTWLLVVACCVGATGQAWAQSGGTAERKLEQVRKELKDVAGERRKLEGQRGVATRKLRAADEQVGSSALALRQTEEALLHQREVLAGLETRRTLLANTLAGQRQELAGLLRAAYRVGGAAPLKLMLAQDDVAAASRVLTYHRYLQAARTARIRSLAAELAGLDALERDIAARQVALDAARARQREQLATLEHDRKARAAAVAQLEARYRDRKEREKVLAKDAKGLEAVLARLRVAARKAAAAKAAAEKAAARSASVDAPRRGAPKATSRRTPTAVASAAPVQVGGLGWPLSGSLLAGFGARMPDGRASTGLLIAAPAGSTVQAVADGSVVFSEWMTGYGMILIVDHGNGYMSLYAHNDALLRKAGEQVRRGDAVASVGNSGGQGRPGLYFELRRNGQPIDPRSWLQKR